MFHKQKFKPIKPINKSPSLEEKPYWYNSFKIRGYKDAFIPATPPPSFDNYGAILTWITNDQFELDEDINFAISIWLGECNLNEEMHEEDKNNTTSPSSPSASFW